MKLFLLCFLTWILLPFQSVWATHSTSESDHIQILESQAEITLKNILSLLNNSGSYAINKDSIKVLTKHNCLTLKQTVVILPQKAETLKNREKAVDLQKMEPLQTILQHRSDFPFFIGTHKPLDLPPITLTQDFNYQGEITTFHHVWKNLTRITRKLLIHPIKTLFISCTRKKREETQVEPSQWEISKNGQTHSIINLNSNSTELEKSIFDHKSFYNRLEFLDGAAYSPCSLLLLITTSIGFELYPTYPALAYCSLALGCFYAKKLYDQVDQFLLTLHINLWNNQVRVLEDHSSSIASTIDQTLSTHYERPLILVIIDSNIIPQTKEKLCKIHFQEITSDFLNTPYCLSEPKEIKKRKKKKQYTTLINSKDPSR